MVACDGETRGEAGLGIITGSVLRGNARKRTLVHLAAVVTRLRKSKISTLGYLALKFAGSGRHTKLSAQERIKCLKQRAVNLSNAVPAPDISQ